MGDRTPLYDRHLQLGARVVEFGGWDMPLHYGSQVEEHHQVRRASGVFDVSHMAVVDIEGADARPFLKGLLANNVDRLKVPGKALYSCMLNEQGGVLDDLIVYYLREDWFRLVVNAGTRQKDLAWIQQQARAFAVHVSERAELAILAVQGPHARAKVHEVVGAEIAEKISRLAPFNTIPCEDFCVARTGYTGEDGYEIILPAERAGAFWDALLAVGVAPIGLGARDTLRLEAGLNLYGTDMDESTTPLESGLEWTVAWEPAERVFIGRQALEQQRRSGGLRRQVGLILEGPGVLRGHQSLMCAGRPGGELTSGGFAPTLNRAIGLARVEPLVTEECKVDIRGRLVPVRLVKPPFVRFGKPCIEL